MERPRFKPHYVVVPAGENAVVLLSERKRVLLRGRLVSRLAPLLDGSRDVDEIVDALRDDADEGEVREALQALESRGHLAGGAESAAGSRDDVFWSMLNASPPKGMSVRLEVIGDLDRDLFSRTFEENGIQTSPDVDLTVAITDDYLRPALRELNRQMIASRRPWLLAKPVGIEVWIGPIFAPGREPAACWECLATRLHENREVESFVSRGAEPIVVSRAATTATLRTAAGIVATQAARWMGTGTSPLAGTLMSLDLLSLESRSHAVIRRPQCEVCGSPDSLRDGPLIPEALLKERERTNAEETVARYRHLISPITGFVSRLESAGALVGPGAHVYFAGHNFARQTSGTIDALRASLRSQSSGKGITDAQAKASALGEALERASGIFEGWEPRRRATFLEIQDSAVHPEELLLYSAQQYETRDPHDERDPPRRVPMRFDEARAIDWSPVWSLTERAVRHVPTAYCFYRYPIEADHAFCYADSNGCAAGTTIEEAVLQGFFELVERDGVALWWYSRARRPAIDAAAWADPFFAAHDALLGTLGREGWLLDLTSDFGIPIVAAVSRKVRGAERILLGFGAHWNPRIAALRAATELHQMIAWTRSAQRRGVELMADSPTLRWLREASVEKNSYLAPSGVIAPSVADRSHWSDDDAEANVRRAAEEVQRRGLQMLVLDQTKPDIGLPVVKVMIPGMRHFWARFAPGRLYDVPVTLGWTRRLSEAELNPVELVL